MEPESEAREGTERYFSQVGLAVDWNSDGLPLEDWDWDESTVLHEPILSPKTCSTYGLLYLVLSYGFLPNRGAHRCYRFSGSKSARKVGSSSASDGWLPHAQTPAAAIHSDGTALLGRNPRPVL
jgi:hypothetical protein